MLKLMGSAREGEKAGLGLRARNLFRELMRYGSLRGEGNICALALAVPLATGDRAAS